MNKILAQINEKEEVKLPETFLTKWLMFSNENITSEEQAKEILEAEKNVLKYQILEGKLMNDNEIKLESVSYTHLDVYKRQGLNVTNLFNKNYKDYLNRMRFFSYEMGRNFILNIKYNF